MKDNRGLSLVELLVVIAIISVLATLGAMSVSAVYSGNATRCAEGIGALASKTKINSMARAGDVAVAIYATEDGVFGDYYEHGDVVSTEKLANGRVKISYQLSGGGEIDIEPNGEKIYLSFERGTGALKDVASSAKAAAAGAVTDISPREYVKEIRIEAPGGAKTILFYKTTGKHVLQ